MATATTTATTTLRIPAPMATPSAAGHTPAATAGHAPLVATRALPEAGHPADPGPRTFPAHSGQRPVQGSLSAVTQLHNRQVARAKMLRRVQLSNKPRLGNTPRLGRLPR